MTGVSGCVGVSVKKWLHSRRDEALSPDSVYRQGVAYIPYRPMVHRILAGQQRGSGRATWCCDRYMVGETNGIGQEFLKVWKCHVQTRALRVSNLRATGRKQQKEHSDASWLKPGTISIQHIIRQHMGAAVPNFCSKIGFA